MDLAADQERPNIELTDSLMARVWRIPQLVDRQVLLIKATGGYKFMERFAASEAEVRAAAEKSIAQMCALQLRLAVAEDLLRNTTIINRCIETYEERVKELLVELAGPKVIEAAEQKRDPEHQAEHDKAEEQISGPDGPVADSNDGYKIMPGEEEEDAAPGL